MKKAINHKQLETMIEEKSAEYHDFICKYIKDVPQEEQIYIYEINDIIRSYFAIQLLSKFSLLNY